MLKNILAFIQGKQKPLLQAIVLTFSVQAVQTAAYLLVFFLMLYLTSDPTYIGIHAFSLALLLLALGYYFVSFAASSASLKSGYDIVADIRVRLAAHLRTLCLLYTSDAADE